VLGIAPAAALLRVDGMLVPLVEVVYIQTGPRFFFMAASRRECQPHILARSREQRTYRKNVTR
jgi:hypothetical protein